MHVSVSKPSIVQVNPCFTWPAAPGRHRRATRSRGAHAARDVREPLRARQTSSWEASIPGAKAAGCELCCQRPGAARWLLGGSRFSVSIRASDPPRFARKPEARSPLGSARSRRWACPICALCANKRMHRWVQPGHQRSASTRGLLPRRTYVHGCSLAHLKCYLGYGRLRSLFGCFHRLKLLSQVHPLGCRWIGLLPCHWLNIDRKSVV